MRPRVGLKNLVSRLKQVVLPAPLGPISAWMVPRATRRFTPLTATKPANSLVRPSVSRMVSLLTAHGPIDRGSVTAFLTKMKSAYGVHRAAGTLPLGFDPAYLIA